MVRISLSATFDPWGAAVEDGTAAVSQIKIDHQYDYTHTLGIGQLSTKREF